MIPSAGDCAFMDLALDQARRAGEAGDVPVGAVLVRDNAVVASAGNRTARDRDPTAHAEMLVIRDAAESLDDWRLGGCTLYVTLEPCAMCAGAIYWSGIGRVVYALSEKRLLQLTGDHPENPTLSLPCREVFARGQREIEVVGPMLEDEAAAPHQDFWR